MFRGDGASDEPRAEIIEIANRPIPSSADEQAGAFRGQARGSSGAWLTRRRVATAVAGLTIVLGLAVVVGQANLFAAPLPRVSPAPASSSIFPASAARLPVISVDAANAKDLDGSSVATELAVGGWYTAMETLAVCHPTGQAYVPCGELWTTRLLSSATPLFGSDGASLPQAVGAAVLRTVFVSPVRKPDLPVTNPLETHPTIDPTPLVLVGHFHDDRASSCSSTSPQAVACGPAFVVDAVADLTGVVRTSGATATGLDPALSAAAVVALIRGHLQPGGVVLEFGPVIWFADGINFSPVEPDPDGPPVDARFAWLVRGHLGGRPSWLAIDDGTGRIWGPLASTPTIAPLAAGIPDRIEGLPVRSVGQAVQGRPRCCQLVAIGGYLTNNRAPEGCPLGQTGGKPTACGDTQLALIDAPNSILVPNDATFLYEIAIPPGVPAVRPLILPGTLAPDPWAEVTGLAARAGPRQVILVGQFGDPRSPECAARPGGGNIGCDRSFVVDQIAWIEGRAEGSSVWVGPGIAPLHSPDQVARLAQNLPRLGSVAWIVSLTATPAAESVGLTGVTVPERHGTALVWILRLVGDRSSPTPGSGYLVIDDASLAVVEQAWLVFANP